MLIRVEERHIKNGVRNDDTGCPIALALKDVLKEWYSPSVNERVVDISDRANDKIVKALALPHNAFSFIFRFDSEQLVGPIEFDLDVNDYTIVDNQGE